MTGDRCPLCSASTRHQFEKCGHEIRRCCGCGVVFTAGPWSLAQALDLYAAPYFAGATPEGYTDYVGLKGAMRRTARHRLRRLPPGGRLLDVGCAIGTFIAEARAVYGTTGTDVSLHACGAARAIGLDIVTSDAEALPFCSGTFDVVTMWDTIEHLAQPLAALREVARVLRPGGTLMLTTGDASSWAARLTGRFWHLLNVPEHRFFFSPRSVAWVLDRAGLQRTACYRDGAHYSTAYLIERLTKSFVGSAVGIERVARSRWLQAVSLYINLFDVMTVEAVRPLSAATRERP